MNVENSKNFTEDTLVWLENADLKERQALGQYMTPRFLREYLLDQLDLKAGNRVLDPAVGTGEFLREALERCPELDVVGWDVDPKILEVARGVVPSAKLENRSALNEFSGDLFDFVIGNPPYFEMKLDSFQKKLFKEVISGRANIFGLFFKVGIEALKVGGTLAYVVPPSMNAGAYFKNLREYLTLGNHVVSLKVFNNPKLFIDAQTSVQVIVVRKGPSISNNVFDVVDTESGFSSKIFCENPKQFQAMYADSVSMRSLGYEAVTGTTVWNQHKDQLVNFEDSTTVPLLYARNIVDGVISLSSDLRRPQFIQNGRSFIGEAIIVNRIIGGVGNGVIKAALVPKGYRFAAENHLNVIRPIQGVKPKVTFEELFKLITSPSIVEKARAITGNTQLSATEWTYLMPLAN
jgi:adenine-specific DNA-methyltransferase